MVRRGDALLVAQRGLGKRHGGRWEFPGGKVEPGESDVEVSRRELREELDASVTRVGAPMFAATDTESGLAIVFVPTSIEGEPRCLEHQAVAWATPGELARLDLAPTDHQFLAYLMAGHPEG